MPSSIKCKPVQADCQKRHVSNLEVIVPNEDQANNENEHLDAEDRSRYIIEEFDDVRAKSTNEQIVEEVIENEAKEIDRSIDKKVEDGPKFEEEIEAIVLESDAKFTNHASLWWGV